MSTPCLLKTMYRPLHLCCIVLLLALSEATSAQICDGLQSCMKFHPTFHLDQYFNLLVAENYNSMCRMKDELHSCFNNNINHCQEEHVQFFVLASSTINFFCSTEGQQGLQTIADSPCVNKTKIGDSDKCLNLFQSNLQVAYTKSKNNTQGNPCPFIDQLKVCIEESIKVSCGLVFSTFSRNIINIQYKPLETNYGCTRPARQIHDRDLRNIFPNIGRQKMK